MIYYIGDTHFGHENCLKFDNRPFSSIEENDDYIMSAWNSRVTDKDTIYIIGDLVYRSTRTADWYLKRLKGIKHLIIGNHDRKYLNDRVRSYFEGIYDICDLNDDGRRVIACHYPLAEWNGMYRNAYHVYGHIHTGSPDVQAYMRTKERAFNVGVMHNNYMPVTLSELIARQANETT